MTKGSVTSPLRSPFTEFTEAAGSAEHQETPRGSHGLRHTVGELLSCPFCLGVWIGTAYVAGLGVAPRATRTWAAVFAVVATSDALQHAYARLRAD
jgi:DNA-binding helix-hairpin-helix protein with protein kinase domain